MNGIYKNVTEALPALAHNIMSGSGIEVASRGGSRTMEILHPQVTLTRPWQREVLTPGRKANIAAQIAETMWVLAGRNDIEWLSRYLPRAKDFSDDGKTWRAGYGPRLRSWHGHDQLQEVIQRLKGDQMSRRGVISLWDPSDGSADSKDIPCLAGETLLWSPEGDLPIAQVADKFSSGEVTRWPVYAVDPVTQEQNIRWATNVWKSGTKKTIRLNFDDGSNIRLTPDHKLYIKRQKHGTIRVIEEICAGNLRPGDRVLATQRFYQSKGYERHKKQLDVNTAHRNMRNTHRAYAELLFGKLPDGYDVHHKNEIKTDNRAENLEVLAHGEHAALKMFGDRNPMRNLTPEQHASRAAKQSAALRGRKHSPETIERMRQAALLRQPDNHVVVSVEEDEVVPVYDFTVPGEHTALVGTGVVAHNCNNWLHFINRSGRLHLQVAIRSNDLIWGWSGINTFEWSALQEIVAKKLGLQVGELVFNMGSLHVYDRHWDKARALAEARLGRDHGLGDSPRFDPPVGVRFDGLLEQWFNMEELIRNGKPHPPVNQFPEPMFRSWLRILQWYWSGGNAAYLKPLQGTRLASAALMTPMSVLPKFRDVMDSVNQPDQSGFVKYAKKLHEGKDQAYGDSWVRRGEMLGVLANLARKVDRLGVNGGGDTELDTAVDLLLYLCKYHVWLNDVSEKTGPRHRALVGARLDLVSKLPRKADRQKALEDKLRVGLDNLEKEVTQGDSNYAKTIQVQGMIEDAFALASTLYWKQGNAARSWNPEAGQ